MISCFDSARGKSTPSPRVFGPRDTARQTGSAQVLVQKNMKPQTSAEALRNKKGHWIEEGPEVNGRAYLGERERESSCLIIKSQIHIPFEGPPYGDIEPCGASRLGNNTIQASGGTEAGAHTSLRTCTSAFLTYIWLIHSPWKNPSLGMGLGSGEKLCPCPKPYLVP